MTWASSWASATACSCSTSAVPSPPALRRRSGRTRGSSRPTWESRRSQPEPVMVTETVTPALQVDALDTGYLGTPVVRDLSMHVAPGEVVAMLGPNGAGKTTTLETIAGLHQPMRGTISMHGENVAGRRAHLLARAGLALVPEGRALFPGLTVREHLRLARTKGAVGERDLLEML